jgi:amidase
MKQSAKQQFQLIRNRKLSPNELVQLHSKQIERVNPAINAVVSTPLVTKAGVPFSVKDAIEVTGTRCTAGTWGRRNAGASTHDALLVKMLRDAGAAPIAKTNLPDMLFAFESDNVIFGRTNNPYDLTRTAGGSSGGEAALIAACGSPWGLGSDAAGSVRVPAAFCGIAGLKPTSNCLPREGHFPPASGWIEALWQIGPMARYVEDLKLMMEIFGRANRSPAAAPQKPRIAFYTDNGFAAADAEVSAVVHAAAKAIAPRAKSVTEHRMGCLEMAYDLEMKLIGPDGGDSLRQFAAALGSTRLHPLLTGWLEKLEAYRTDLAGFQRYWAEWERYRAEMSSFLFDYDAILCPAYIHPALPHGTSTLDEHFRGFSHTMAFNVAGWPAGVVRCGESATGLPIAVQVAAGPWQEDLVLTILGWLEEIFGGWKPTSLV